MTVSELIEKLKTLPPSATLELAEGSSIDDICYNRISKRVCLSTEDERVAVEDLVSFWRYL